MMRLFASMGRRTMDVAVRLRFAQLLVTAALLIGATALQATSLYAGLHTGRPRRRPTPAALMRYAQQTPPRISVQDGRNAQSVSALGCRASNVADLPSAASARLLSTALVMQRTTICPLAHAPPVVGRASHARLACGLSSRLTSCLLGQRIKPTPTRLGFSRSRVFRPAIGTMVKP